MAGRLRHLDDTADLDDGLALSDHLFGGLELADDLLRCVLVRFMVKSPAQSGRLMTLIHPGQTSGVDVIAIKKTSSYSRKDSFLATRWVLMDHLSSAAKEKEKPSLNHALLKRRLWM